MTTVPFESDCNKEAGFVMDPNEYPRVGYVTAFNGPDPDDVQGDLQADLAVTHPLTGAKMTVVGVVENFSWTGAVEDVAQLDFWVSQENMPLIRSMQVTAAKNAVVRAVNFTVVSYDQEKKIWFTELALDKPLAGVISGREDPALRVDPDPQGPFPVQDGMDVNVYRISAVISPTASQAYVLEFANSPITVTSD